MSNQLINFQVLGWASLGQAMFADIQKDYHRMKVENEEAVQAAAKYREDLHTCKSELKESLRWRGSVSILSLL